MMKTDLDDGTYKGTNVGMGLIVKYNEMRQELKPNSDGGGKLTPREK